MKRALLLFVLLAITGAGIAVQTTRRIPGPRDRPNGGVGPVKAKPTPRILPSASPTPTSTPR